MNSHNAKGAFEVTLNPLPVADGGKDMRRMSIAKEFTGDIVGTSKGEMLSAGDPTKGSAGYVAIEVVTCTLGGRKGTFILQHSATMNRGVPQSAISVVPDSGTDELAGIAGTFQIEQKAGKHFYAFEYTLP